jgi:hypothetical protein
MTIEYICVYYIRSRNIQAIIDRKQRVFFHHHHSLTMTGHFFEGAEKLLEIWFTTSNSDSGKGSLRHDLRNIPR